MFGYNCVRGKCDLFKTGRTSKLGWVGEQVNALTIQIFLMIDQLYHKNEYATNYLSIMQICVIDVSFYIDNLTDKYYNRKLCGHMDKTSSYCKKFKSTLVSMISLSSKSRYEFYSIYELKIVGKAFKYFLNDKNHRYQSTQSYTNKSFIEYCLSYFSHKKE